MISETSSNAAGITFIDVAPRLDAPETAYSTRYVFAFHLTTYYFYDKGGVVMEKRGIFIGTSGWTYDDWSGSFYPERVKGADRLPYYAEHFNAVEVNATYYRFPTETMIKAWNKKLPDDFHMVLKGHRKITHNAKPENCEDTLKGFLERAEKLDPLRVILWQLPPSLEKDNKRLEQFLKQLPETIGHAVEFRHESWWSDDVADLLKEYNAAFVAVSHPEMPEDFYPTADFLYARFHGVGDELYKYDYSEKELREWADRLKKHLDDRTLYAFFNNDYNAYAVKNAGTFRDLLRS